jgi:hypothetical protein
MAEDALRIYHSPRLEGRWGWRTRISRGQSGLTRGADFAGDEISIGDGEQGTAP